MGECLNGIQKVEGSNPFSSILSGSQRWLMKKVTLILFPFIILLLVNFVLISNQQSIEGLKKEVVEIGRLKFKSDIQVKYFDKKELKNYIEQLFAREYPPGLMDKEALFIRLMGFGDGKKIDLREARRKILLENVGGLYNEKTGELYALDEYRNVDFMNSLILVHELRHGIVDHHFKLSDLLAERPPSDFDDRKLALLAAIEGDATFVMVKFSDFDAGLLTSGFNSDTLLSFLPSGNNARLSDAADILKHQFIMPYLEGLKFVDYIFSKKKWTGVNRILLAPPLSSEQILHPGKYLKKEPPVQVVIDYRPGGYTLYHAGVIGEYYLNILMKPKDKYIDYARGWGGDKFEIYKNDSFYCLLWESAWDKPEYCSNFYHDFKRFIEKKFEINFRKGSKPGRDFAAGSSADGYFFISQLKNKLFYVRTDDRKQINNFISGGHYD